MNSATVAHSPPILNERRRISRKVGRDQQWRRRRERAQALFRLSEEVSHRSLRVHEITSLITSFPFFMPPALHLPAQKNDPPSPSNNSAHSLSSSLPTTADDLFPNNALLPKTGVPTSAENAVEVDEKDSSPISNDESPTSLALDEEASVVETVNPLAFLFLAAPFETFLDVPLDFLAARDDEDSEDDASSPILARFLPSAISAHVSSPPAREPLPPPSEWERTSGVLRAAEVAGRLDMERAKAALGRPRVEARVEGRDSSAARASIILRVRGTGEEVGEKEEGGSDAMCCQTSSLDRADNVVRDGLESTSIALAASCSSSVPSVASAFHSLFNASTQTRARPLSFVVNEKSPPNFPPAPLPVLVTLVIDACLLSVGRSTSSLDPLTGEGGKSKLCEREVWRASGACEPRGRLVRCFLAVMMEVVARRWTKMGGGCSGTPVAGSGSLTSLTSGFDSSTMGMRAGAEKEGRRAWFSLLPAVPA